MSKINKILILTHPETDHLGYMMYNGLYKVLGKENIDIYPFIRHYRKEIDDWYIQDNGRPGYTAPPEYIGEHEIHNKLFDDIVNNINSYDIIYLSSARTYAIRALDQFISRCGKNLPPLVFSEGEDYQDLITIRNIKHKYNPIVCFKRELLKQDLDNNPNLHPLYPLPFSTITDNILPDNPNKDIDIFAHFGRTHPIRDNIFRLINSSNLSGKYNVSIRSDNCHALSYKNYLDIMSRSKINIIARGWGYDSLRRFEATYYSGLVMSDNIPIITPDPFIDNQHIIYYNNDLSDLINRIEYYLNAPNERERIGRGGKEHCSKYHTTEARARYFLNKIEQHI